MLVMLDGIVTLVSLLQPKNAPSPMLVTLDGIVTLVSSLQPSNAQVPMLVTGHPPRILGIDTEPVVEAAIALVEPDQLPTTASPPLISYVHVIPVSESVQVSPKTPMAIPMTITSINILFIQLPPILYVRKLSIAFANFNVSYLTILPQLSIVKNIVEVYHIWHD